MRPFKIGDVVQRRDRNGATGTVTSVYRIGEEWYVEVRWLRGGRAFVTTQSAYFLKSPDDDIITALGALQ